MTPVAEVWNLLGQEYRTRKGRSEEERRGGWTVRGRDREGIDLQNSGQTIKTRDRQLQGERCTEGGTDAL